MRTGITEVLRPRALPEARILGGNATEERIKSSLAVELQPDHDQNVPVNLLQITTRPPVWHSEGSTLSVVETKVRVALDENELAGRPAA